MRTFEQQKALVRRLNVIDDVFFHKIAENQEVCEEFMKFMSIRKWMIIQYLQS